MDGEKSDFLFCLSTHSNINDGNSYAVTFCAVFLVVGPTIPTAQETYQILYPGLSKIRLQCSKVSIDPIPS